MNYLTHEQLFLIVLGVLVFGVCCFVVIDTIRYRYRRSPRRQDV